MPLTGAKRFQVRGEGGREAVATPVGCGFLAAASWCCDCSPTTVDAPRRAWEHPEAGRALGLAGREWVRSRYSAERLVEDLASLYEELLERREPRSGYRSAPYPVAPLGRAALAGGTTSGAYRRAL